MQKLRWHTRWFVLRSGDLPGQYLLEYYVDKTRKKLKGRIDLDQCEQVDAGIIFASQKDPSENNFMFDIRTPSRVYYLRCQTELEMNHWVDCLCQVCGLKAQVDDATASNPVVFPHPAQIAANPLPHVTQSTNISVENDHAFLSSSVGRAESNMYISGPYIPISECITGRKPSSNNRDNNNAPSDNGHGGNRRRSIPSEMAPPAPMGRSAHDTTSSTLVPSASSTSTLVLEANISTNGWKNFGDASTLPHQGGHSKHRGSQQSIENSRGLRGQNPFGRRTTRSCGSNSEDSSVVSPPGTGSSSSVCTDEDRSSATPLNNTVFFGGTENHGSTAFDCNLAAHAIRTMVKDPLKQEDAEAPPRPPKPAHLEVPQQNYMNIDSIKAPNSRKNSVADAGFSKMSNSTSLTSHDGNFISYSDAEPSPVSASSSVASINTQSAINNDVHDFPRSLPTEVVSAGSVIPKRYGHSSAVPSSVTSDSVFSYDIRNASSHTAGENDPRISPALYTNLSSINNGIGGSSKAPSCPPPTINRGLKPKISSSDGSSLSGCDTSPSMDTPCSSAPAIDRNLKPPPRTGMSAATDAQYGNNTPEFVLEPAPRSRPRTGGDKARQQGAVRAAPSPTLPSPHQPPADDEEPPPSAHSWRNSAVTEEQVFYPPNSVRSPPSEIQYLDLDLNSGGGLGSTAISTADLSNTKSFLPSFSSSKTQLGKKTGSSSSSAAIDVEYQTVDFVKTDALLHVKEKVQTYKVKHYFRQQLSAAFTLSHKADY
ncbi:hypothetical protein HAZT_HAZT007769 [Hyalella azteca]|uniref:PH domain-containing protein n=1 Tax=Hyalella azteca TaxID=294128 RepID=A0A6A0GVB2_HYAAZ|nr:hypothetical protein HAZT_HAZT007769 [Hyalella azteca]